MSYGVANILAPELKGLNHFKPTWILNCLGVCWKVPWEMQHRCLLPLLLMPACMQSGCSAVEQTEHPKALLSFSLYRFAVPAITCSEHCSCHVFVSIERSNSYLTDLGCVCIPVSLCFPHMPSFLPNASCYISMMHWGTFFSAGKLLSACSAEFQCSAHSDITSMRTRVLCVSTEEASVLGWGGLQQMVFDFLC